MPTMRLGGWRGQVLFDHLVARLVPDHENFDLYVHTLRALLTVRPHILHDPGRLAALRDQLDRLLGYQTDAATARHVRAADQVRYAIRTAEARRSGAMPSTDDDFEPTARFLFEAGTLKRARRTGWWMAGATEPESIEEHSWRSALITAVIAQLEGADSARAALMAVWHDTQETRTGEPNRLAKKYLGGQEVDHRAITANQTAGMPAALRTLVRELIDEYEDQECAAARCAGDADKLECMLQGIEYRDRGHVAAQRWIDSCRASIRTKTGQTLADLLLSMKPIAWLNHVLGEPDPSGPRE